MIELLADPGVEPRLTTSLGYFLTAGLLGIVHGIEPDHVAGITALTHEAGDPKLSAIVGVCFATGHVVLVVMWIAAAYLLFGTTSVPPVYERIGTLFVGIVLGVMSLYLGITGTRKLIHRHRHEHGKTRHSHFHIHLPVSAQPVSDENHTHEHTRSEYLKIGIIGALFTLSPPVSMVAFISVTVPGGGRPLMTGIVAAYTLTIIATMAVIGGGASSLFQMSKARGERVHAIFQVITGIVVLGFALNILADLPAGLSG